MPSAQEGCLKVWWSVLWEQPGIWPWGCARPVAQASAVGLSHQPHQGHRCQRPEQVFVVAQSQPELSFVSGADGKPWRAWTER